MPPVKPVLFELLWLVFELISATSAAGMLTTAPPAAICPLRLLSPQDPPAFPPMYQPLQNDCGAAVSCAAACPAAARMARDAPAASSESRRVEMIVTSGPSSE